MTGTEDHVTWLGTFIGGIAGGVIFAVAWLKKFASKGIDSEALKQLKAVERKNAEEHAHFDQRLKEAEKETWRQKGVLEQINERVGEVLDLVKAFNNNKK